MNLAVMLCDAVTVREGMLHILGGGISVIRRSAFPTEAGFDAAVLFTLDGSELGYTHVLGFALLQPDGTRLDVGQLVVPAVAHDRLADLDIEIPFSLTTPVLLSRYILRLPGLYDFECSIDGTVSQTLRFRAEIGVRQVESGPRTPREPRAPAKRVTKKVAVSSPRNQPPRKGR